MDPVNLVQKSGMQPDCYAHPKKVEGWRIPPMAIQNHRLESTVEDLLSKGEGPLTCGGNSCAGRKPSLLMVPWSTLAWGETG